MPSLTLIVAATLANGIGQAGRLPWRLSHDMAYFARVTTSAPQGSQNAVIMGRNTWESIPPKNRPLKERANVIITSNSNYLNGNKSEHSGNVTLKSSFEEAVSSVTSQSDSMTSLNRIFIIGGASVYKRALDLVASPDNSSQSTAADRILMTRICSPVFEDCDVFFPEFREMKATDGTPLWTQASHEELEAWVGGEVPQGKQQEKGIEYEFQMWTRKV
ncbi:hypothetical protein A7U60_g6672 [Sanghuangporus baumii]|uniref:Dihydrofolate reductase n=1 Tax=Sanghuangporus baumii TaxID=108892 RepID=A0A9Q5N156_SANBA|nr:hypothetical protein A7U60_g6672 [Sanghuangporus baumii]